MNARGRLTLNGAGDTGVRDITAGEGKRNCKGLAV